MHDANSTALHRGFTALHGPQAPCRSRRSVARWVPAVSARRHSSITIRSRAAVAARTVSLAQQRPHQEGARMDGSMNGSWVLLRGVDDVQR